MMRFVGQVSYLPFFRWLQKLLLSRQQDNLTARINAACAQIDISLPADIARLTRQKLVEVEY